MPCNSYLSSNHPVFADFVEPAIPVLDHRILAYFDIMGI
jgi:hypothetical protein